MYIIQRRVILETIEKNGSLHYQHPIDHRVLATVYKALSESLFELDRNEELGEDQLKDLLIDHLTVQQITSEQLKTIVTSEPLRLINESTPFFSKDDIDEHIRRFGSGWKPTTPLPSSTVEEMIRFVDGQVCNYGDGLGFGELTDIIASDGRWRNDSDAIGSILVAALQLSTRIVPKVESGLSTYHPKKNAPAESN
ncbi:hypothetical protein VCHA53O466_40369 [Vibrio chagasii]|nr:hypothetical protein VCHA53O466_40369 [Vibrio chagasii]